MDNLLRSLFILVRSVFSLSDLIVGRIVSIERVEHREFLTGSIRA